MFNLLSNISDSFYNNGDVPHLMAIRWKSMYTCVEFIHKNIQALLPQLMLSKIQ